MTWSILICTLENRKHFLERLLDVLLPQIGDYVKGGTGNYSVYTGKAQICILSDNKVMSVGEKRNKLIEASEGEYVSFIDDDDIVSGEYVEAILRKLRNKPDVVTFWAYRFHNGKKDRRVNYDIKFEQDLNPAQEYQRLPNHLCCWKKSLYLPYKEISYGEDAEWAVRMKGQAKTQEKVDKILYHYYFSSLTTETQKQFYK